jgi:ABC-type cobalamin transport system permease subunit
MLQEHEGALSFATDAWMSPNHKVFVAVTVHFENNRVPLCMILDVVEVVISHSGVNLAAVFADILAEFGVSDKVH